MCRAVVALKFASHYYCYGCASSAGRAFEHDPGLHVGSVNVRLGKLPVFVPQLRVGETGNLDLVDLGEK